MLAILSTPFLVLLLDFVFLHTLFWEPELSFVQGHLFLTVIKKFIMVIYLSKKLMECTHTLYLYLDFQFGPHVVKQ